VVKAYNAVVHFKEGIHHIYVQAKKDPNQQWLPTRYRLTEEEMGHIMEDLDDHWKIPRPGTKKSVETRQSDKQNSKVQDIDDDEEEGEE
jgi:hypothetical protein